MVDMPCFVGIDVAKAQLDIAVRPSGERWAVPNDAGGVGTLVERLQPLPPLACGGSPRRRGAGRHGGVSHGRCAIVRVPQGSWPRRRRWLPAPWPLLPPGFVRRPARCRTPRRRSCAPGSDVATHGWSCGPLRRTVWRGRAVASKRTWRRISPGATRAWPGWTTPSRRCSGRVRCGGKPTTSDKVPRAWDPCGRARCGWNAPRWGRSHASQWRRWWAWRPSMATGGLSGGGAASGEAAPPCAPCSPWVPSWPRVTTRGAKPVTNGSSRRGRSKKGP